MSEYIMPQWLAVGLERALFGIANAVEVYLCSRSPRFLRLTLHRSDKKVQMLAHVSSITNIQDSARCAGGSWVAFIGPEDNGEHVLESPDAIMKALNAEIVEVEDPDFEVKE